MTLLLVTMYLLSFELVYGAFFWQQQRLTTMFITRCLVFFGLFLLALFLSPFGLELKYEVGVWMKLT